MATTADTLTSDKPLVLTPPEPAPVVARAQAAGLVPIDAGVKSKLEERVGAFVTDLVAQDVNSP